jgi:hypothetical protein
MAAKVQKAATPRDHEAHQIQLGEVFLDRAEALRRVEGASPLLSRGAE